MKSYVVVCFIFALVLATQTVYGLNPILHGAGKCDTSFEHANITLEIYSTEPYKPYLIEETNGVYYFEIVFSGDKTKISEEIWGNLEVKCDHKSVGRANVEFDTYLKTEENMTLFFLNGTFLVPKGALSCLAEAEIYGSKNDRTDVCMNNCFCSVKGFHTWPHISTKEKEVWTREQFLMNKWARELEKSNDEQRKQNERYMSQLEKNNKEQKYFNFLYIIFGIVGVILGAIVTALATYWAENRIHQEKQMREYNEKIYGPIQKSILFTIDRVNKFLEVETYRPTDADFGNDYVFWINIRDSPKSEIARAHDRKLYEKINRFFEISISEYNKAIDIFSREAMPKLLEEISKIRKHATSFSDGNPAEILSMILRENTHESVYAETQFRKGKMSWICSKLPDSSIWFFPILFYCLNNTPYNCP